MNTLNRLKPHEIRLVVKATLSVKDRVRLALGMPLAVVVKLDCGRWPGTVVPTAGVLIGPAASRILGEGDAVPTQPAKEVQS